MAAQAEQGQDYILVGQISKPHGVRGEVRVTPQTDRPERFTQLDRIFVNRKGHRTPLKILRARLTPSHVILMLDGIDSREAAESLRDADLEILRTECFEIPEGRYFYFDLIGLQVVTDQGVQVGPVVDIISYPAQDVYVVESEHNRIMIPDAPDIITQIDMQKGEIVVHELPGLFDLQA
jgi:16S rRNA processing protein RimM